MELDEKMKDVLQILSQNGDMATLDIAMHSGLSLKTTQRKLNELVNASYVSHIQVDGRRLYQIVNQDKNPIKCETGKVTNTSKKIFISHSSKDKTFVKYLFDLLISVGIPKSNIFCSTIPECGIPNSRIIPEHLRKVILNDTVYMIYVVSPRYYESATSLNEMGAGWALNLPYCCILMRNIEVNEMKGVYNSSTIAISVKGEDAASRLLAMLRAIESVLKISIQNDTTCSQEISTFLKSARRCGSRKSNS